MENYALQENETILYRGNVIYPAPKKIKKSEEPTKKQTELYLTNYNIVLIISTKKLFKEVVETEIYSVKTIKFYNEQAQLKQNGAYVEIYLTSKELFLKFESKKQAKAFMLEALRLVTGESSLVRSVKKIRKNVAETNDALGIDIGKAASATLGVVSDIAIELSKSSTAGQKTKFAGTIARVLRSKKATPQLSEASVKDDDANKS